MNETWWEFLTDPERWSWADPFGFPARIVEHLQFTGISLAVAFVIAFPVGLIIGHTNRGAFAAINIGNAARALPSVGVVMLCLALIGTGLTPALIALIVLAIPPIMTSTYAGIHGVAPEVVDAASGVGMKPWQVITQVELPQALPIVIGGIRNATLQVISTATIAAFVGNGGLGRFLFDGLGTRNYAEVVAGAIVIAVLAIVVDQLIGLVERLIVSPGVDGRAARGRGRGRRGGSPEPAGREAMAESPAP